MSAPPSGEGELDANFMELARLIGESSAVQTPQPFQRMLAPNTSTPASNASTRIRGHSVLEPSQQDLDTSAIGNRELMNASSHSRRNGDPGQRAEISAAAETGAHASQPILDVTDIQSIIGHYCRFALAALHHITKGQANSQELHRGLARKMKNLWHQWQTKMINKNVLIDTVARAVRDSSPGANNLNVVDSFRGWYERKLRSVAAKRKMQVSSSGKEGSLGSAGVAVHSQAESVSSRDPAGIQGVAASSVREYPGTTVGHRTLNTLSQTPHEATYASTQLESSDSSRQDVAVNRIEAKSQHALQSELVKDVPTARCLSRGIPHGYRNGPAVVAKKRPKVLHPEPKGVRPANVVAPRIVPMNIPHDDRNGPAVVAKKKPKVLRPAPKGVAKDNVITSKIAKSQRRTSSIPDSMALIRENSSKAVSASRHSQAKNAVADQWKKKKSETSFNSLGLGFVDVIVDIDKEQDNLVREEPNNQDGLMTAFSDDSTDLLDESSVRLRLERSMKQNGLEGHVSPEIVDIISLAFRERLRFVLEGAAEMAQARVENENTRPAEFDLENDVRMKLEKTRDEEGQQLRAESVARTKQWEIYHGSFDSDSAKSSAKKTKKDNTAKERLEKKKRAAADARHKDAIASIISGINKKRKKKVQHAPSEVQSSSDGNESTQKISPVAASRFTINLEDCLAYFASEPNMRQSALLYKWYTKLGSSPTEENPQR